MKAGGRQERPTEGRRRAGGQLQRPCPSPARRLTTQPSTTPVCADLAPGERRAWGGRSCLPCLLASSHPSIPQVRCRSCTVPAPLCAHCLGLRDQPAPCLCPEGTGAVRASLAVSGIRPSFPIPRAATFAGQILMG